MISFILPPQVHNSILKIINSLFRSPTHQAVTLQGLNVYNNKITGQRYHEWLVKILSFIYITTQLWILSNGRATRPHLASRQRQKRSKKKDFKYKYIFIYTYIKHLIHLIEIFTRKEKALTGKGILSTIKCALNN